MKSIFRARTPLITILATVAISPTAFSTPSLEYGGYLREYISLNLEDHPDINRFTGEKLGGKGQLSMVRTTLKLEGSADFDWAKFVAIYRSDREQHTSYLNKLEDFARDSSFTPSPPAPVAVPPGLGRGFLDIYDKDELREAYVSIPISDRVRMIFGKQQVVWGETDVIRVTDIIEGYDNRWRSIFEGENEELRKPLILANTIITFPSIDSTLQLIFRPGWDSRSAPINDQDLYGGRWAPQTYRGVDAFFAAPKNTNHSSGDTKDANYGFRWTSMLGQINYSLMYYRGINLDPVVNSAFNPFGDAPTTATGAETIYPMIETFGMSLNAYIAPADTVLRGELAYVPNAPYNIRGFYSPFPPLIGVLPPSLVPSVAQATGVPGLGGIREKNTLKAMIGFDKNINLRSLFKTNRSSLWSTQIFDQWIPNWDKSDDLIEVFGHGAPRKEHWTVLTSTLFLSYRHDRLNPSATLVYDVSSKDTVLVPAVDFVFGDHWRLRTEANIFLPHSSRKPSDSPLETDTNLFGTFANNSQLLVRLTYNF